MLRSIKTQHSSTQPDQIWAQIIRGEVIFMGEDSGVCQKRAHFDIILGALTDIYKNWWHKWTNYKTGLHDQAQDPALLQLTLVTPLLLSRDNPPKFPQASAFLPLTKYDHPQSREKSRGFSFSGAAKSVEHSSEIIISAPVTAAEGFLRTDLLLFYSFQAMTTSVENRRLATFGCDYDPPSFM